MNTVHLPLVWLPEELEWPLCGRSSCDDFYFPYCTLWTRRHVDLVPLRAFMLILVTIPEPARIPFFTYFCSYLFHISSSIYSFRSHSPLCNTRNLCENDSISSYHAHWVRSAMVLAIWDSVCPWFASKSGRQASPKVWTSLDGGSCHLFVYSLRHFDGLCGPFFVLFDHFDGEREKCGSPVWCLSQNL